MYKNSILDKSQRSETKMPAELIQVKLPAEMTPLFADIKAERAKACEPLSNKAIVIDAVKAYHKIKVNKQ